LKTAIENYILELKKITNLTKRNSEKLLMDLMNENKIDELSSFLNKIKNSFSECPTCFYLMENNFCESCMSDKRDKSKICVVSNILDAKAIIDKDIFNGTFHILKGEIDLNKNVAPTDLKISELFDRINNENIEVIIALNATFKGELTSNYLIQEIKSKNKKVSRLARGIPFGGVVNYIDRETMDNAIKNRNKL
jgi:recombination protein RecR